MMSHEPAAGVRNVHKYEVDTLGAPFKISVIDAVQIRTDPKSGKEMIKIPDLVGLINVVVRTRVFDERKLNGPELKFLRKAIGVRSKTLAEFLDMTPEHLSRCEKGAKVMTVTSEKLFRLFIFLATYVAEPQTMLEKFEDIEITKTSEEPAEVAKKFINNFLSMKIRSVFDPRDELHYEFYRAETVEKWSPSLAA